MSNILSGYEKQSFVGDRKPLPVEDITKSSAITSVTGESVQLYYWDSGTLTSDAGQAAGTVVIGRLAKTMVLDSASGMIGNDKDTSLSWTTGTVLTTMVQCPKEAIESPTNGTLEEVAVGVTENMASGEYCLDHRSGIIYGKKATTGTSDTAAYKVMAQSVTATSNTEFTEDAAHSSGATGNLILAVRNDAETAIAGTDGDYIPLTTDSDGKLLTTATATSNTEYADDADWTDSTSKHTLVGGLYQSAPQTVTDGDVAPLQVDVNGSIIESNSATALTALQLIDDAIYADDADWTDSTSKHALVGGLYQTTQQTVTDGDVAPFQLDVGGNLITVGNRANNAVDAGNPVKVGGRAIAFDGTLPGTAVAEADRTDFISDLYGRQYVETTHPGFWSVSADYSSAETNTTIKAAPGAGSLYITDILISNGAVAGNITLLDGSGGSVLVEIYPGVNGGYSSNLRTPIKLSATTLLAITSTSCTTHSVSIQGFTAA